MGKNAVFCSSGRWNLWASLIIKLGWLKSTHTPLVSSLRSGVGSSALLPLEAARNSHAWRNIWQEMRCTVKNHPQLGKRLLFQVMGSDASLTPSPTIFGILLPQCEFISWTEMLYSATLIWLRDQLNFKNFQKRSTCCTLQKGVSGLIVYRKKNTTKSPNRRGEKWWGWKPFVHAAVLCGLSAAGSVRATKRKPGTKTHEASAKQPWSEKDCDLSQRKRTGPCKLMRWALHPNLVACIQQHCRYRFTYISVEAYLETLPNLWNKPKLSWFHTDSFWIWRTRSATLMGMCLPQYRSAHLPRSPKSLSDAELTLI